MATYQNTRRRAVAVTNPFENAEGIIPLNFSNLLLHQLGEKDFTSKRNGLALTKFTAINPTNGDTIGVLVQMDLRDQVLAAFARIKNGEIGIVKNVYGGRAAKDFKTGMTTLVAKKLQLEFTPGVARTIELPEVSAGVLAAADLATTAPASDLAQ